MSDLVILIGFIVVGVLSPVVLAVMSNKFRLADRREEWVRQDRQAETAERHVARVAQNTEDAARLLAMHNQLTAEATAETHSQLSVIHGLVNSAMTASMQSELDATTVSLTLLKRLLAREGDEPSAHDLATVEATQQKLDELTTKLQRRREQDAR